MALLCWPAIRTCAADVSVAGGMDPTNRHFYSWTVTHAGAGRIVAVEIPHYRGLVFTVPPGWSNADVTEPAVGSGDGGVGRLRATAPHGGGVRPGESATFSIQLHARGASAQRGTVIVELDDGTRVPVTNVEYPGMEPWLSRHMTLVGMLALIIAVLAVDRLRRGRAGRTAPPEAP